MAINDRRRLAVFTTHPVQYQVPWFRALSREPDLCVRVYYAMLPDAAQQGTGFGIEFEWDIPLLNGYSWKLLHNRSRTPSLATFRGCDVSEIRRALSSAKPDAAIVTGWHSLYLFQALVACRRLNIPTLVRGESNVLTPRSPFKRTLQHVFLRKLSACLSIGQLNRQFYQWAGIPEERIFDCPYFVDNERFIRQSKAVSAEYHGLRRRFRIPGDATCFVFVGKLIAKKRVMDFLEAIEIANGSKQRIFGLVVGEGGQKNEAQSFVQSRRLPVSFSGFLNQNDIAAAYSVSDCLVLPSDRGETWGLVVNEAMACGIPAVVSDEVGCGPDLVVEGRTGRTFKTRDVRALARSIEELAANRGAMRTMGEAARTRVMEEYSIARAVEGVKHAMSWTLSPDRLVSA